MSFWPPWSLRSTVVEAWGCRSSRSAPLTASGHRSVISFSDAHVHAGRRGSVGGRGGPTALGIGRPRPRVVTGPRRGPAGGRGRRSPAAAPACCWACCWARAGPARRRRCRGRPPAGSVVRPAASRSRRRSGRASSSAARPCSWAPAQGEVDGALAARSPGPRPGPRVSGVRTRVIVCAPSGPPRSTATWRATWVPTGCAAESPVAPSRHRRRPRRARPAPGRPTRTTGAVAGVGRRRAGRPAGTRRRRPRTARRRRPRPPVADAARGRRRGPPESASPGAVPRPGTPLPSAAAVAAPRRPSAAATSTGTAGSGGGRRGRRSPSVATGAARRERPADRRPASWARRRRGRR